MNRSQRLTLVVLILTMAAPIALSFTPSVRAQITYAVDREWVKVWINKDGSVDLQYNITQRYLTGSPQGIVTVGMPKGGFRIDSVRDLSGTSLQYQDVSGGGFYGVDVYLKKPIVLNRSNIFLLYVIVPDMVKEDTTNLGNVGMSFYPSTFPSASGNVMSLRLAIVLPEGVSNSEVKSPAGTPFDNVFTEGERTVVYWERNNWSPSKTLTAGVSFPSKYVNLGPDLLFYAAIAVVVVAAIAIVAVIFSRLRKAVYEKPRVAVEALGAARGLTAAEAAVVLNLKPVRVLTMVLFGLLLKNMVTVNAIEPIIKLEKLERPKDQPSSPVRYYEIDYLRAVQPDGVLNELALARTYVGLRDNVDRKLRGYSRADTQNYYKSVVDNAWSQVTKAETPELKGDAVDQNIEWLLADEGFDQRFKTMFPPDVVVLPRPGWYWYWRGPYVPSGPAGGPLASPGQVGPIPGQEFANNVVRSLETASNNIVKNVQDFANRLIPAQAALSTERSVRSRSGCICACANCACACACVSCACACAHGGSR